MRWIIALSTFVLLGLPVVADAKPLRSLVLTGAAFCYRPTAAQDTSACLALPRWDVGGGLAPDAFSVRVSIRAYGSQVSSGVPVRIEYAIKIGELTVDPETLLVDTAYLNRTAQWRLWGARTETLPMLAPSESTDYIATPVPFRQLVQGLHDLYPVAVQATVTLPGTGIRKVITLPVTSRPFAGQFLPAD